MKKILLVFLVLALVNNNALNMGTHNEQRMANTATTAERQRSSTRHRSHGRLKKKAQMTFNPQDFKQDKRALIKLGEKYLKKLAGDNSKEDSLWFRVRFITDQGVEESLFQKKPYQFSGSNFYFTEEGQSKRGVIKGMDILKAVTNGHDDIKQGLCCEKVKDIKKFTLNNNDFRGYCFQVLLYNDEWSLCHENKEFLNDFRLIFRANIVKEYQKKYNIEQPAILQEPYSSMQKYQRKRKIKG